MQHVDEHHTHSLAPVSASAVLQNSQRSRTQKQNHLLVSINSYLFYGTKRGVLKIFKFFSVASQYGREWIVYTIKITQSSTNSLGSVLRQTPNHSQYTSM